MTGLLLAGCLAGCFQSKPTEVAGGGGVETTGGQIVSLNERSEGARVRMIPASFDPVAVDAFPDSLQTITLPDGRFSFKGLTPGLYNLDIWQPGDGTRLFRAGVSVVAGSSLEIPVDTLRAPCRIRLSLEGAGTGFVYQSGTATKRKVEPKDADSGSLTLDSLPSGTLPPFFLVDPVSNPVPRRLTDSLRIAPGSVNELADFGLWAHHGAWRINAGPSGMKLSGDVLGYPLLLRLTQANFEFTESMPNGEDIRFSDSKGARLPFEIERWDAASRKAEIWVGLKRLAAADSQEIRMHWGKADAKAAGRSEEVFDTAFGFVDAWHLAESGNTKKNGYRDASPTGLGGWGTLMAPDPADSGLIAGAQLFGGDGGNIRMDPAPLGWTGALMVSAWISPGFGTDENKNHVFLARWEAKDSAGFWLEYAPDIHGLRLALGLAAPGKIFTVDAPNLAFAKAEWHHVAAAYDGKEATLYWDGRMVAKASPGPAPLADNPRDFLIGAKGDVDPALAEIQFFKGRMDEVRIYRALRSPDWLMLDYLTQKPGAGTVIWERLP